MVDGQQRSRTLLRFWQGIIMSSDKKSINEIDKDSFLSYEVERYVLLIYLQSTDSMELFYALVNKRGKHLNAPEFNKAQYLIQCFLEIS